MTVRLQSDTPVAAAEFELFYVSPYVSPEPAETGAAADNHRVLSTVPTPGVERIVLYSLVNASLEDGAIVELPFRVPGNAPETTVSLTLGNVMLVTPEGSELVPTSLGAGQLEIIAGAPALLEPPVVQPSGVVDLRFVGTADERYVVQSTSALGSGNWSNVSTNVAVNGVVQTQDTTAVGQPQRFYRAVLDR